MGLAFDESDLDFYLKMFQEMNRNPTTVELFDLSQSNSEHSRFATLQSKQNGT
jgi:phosphoribosylformylglycinamidine synthase